MKIRLFRDFINENIQLPKTKEVIKTQPDDSVPQAADKNFYNEEEELILKFNAWKTDLMNIFKSYNNKKDLINKLFNKKYLMQKTDDPKKMRFWNKYLAKWAKVCDKERNIDDLEEITLGNRKDMIQYDSTIKNNKGNQSVVDYTKNKVEKTKERIQDNLEKIKEEEREIKDITTDIKKEFDKMKKKHIENKKRLLRDESFKKSNPANTGKEETKEEITQEK